jgi:hypothetical protein
MTTPSLREQLLFIVIVALFAQSCSKNVLYGKYDCCGSPYFHETIVIDKDSTFKYQGGTHLGLKESLGRWEVRNKTLILNSFYFETLNGRVNEFRYSNQNYWELRLRTLDSSYAYGNMTILVNDSLRIQSDTHGLIRVKRAIHNLYINMENGYEYRYLVKDTSANTFYVFFDPIENSKISIINRKFRIRKSILVDENGSTFKKII